MVQILVKIYVTATVLLVAVCCNHWLYSATIVYYNMLSMSGPIHVMRILTDSAAYETDKQGYVLQGNVLSVILMCSQHRPPSNTPLLMLMYNLLVLLKTFVRFLVINIYKTLLCVVYVHYIIRFIL